MRRRDDVLTSLRDPMSFTRLADWLAWQETLHPQAIDLGLDRIRRVLARLGWQPPRYPVIAVGGTNGKGSCVALLDSILGAAGYRVGTFTSPHLHRYNERIRIAGEEISDASLVAAFERIDAARGADTLTFFEFNALAALLAFETAGLDVAVLEVGMGGRLDAVNIVDADVSLVTSVALDHCEWLGQDVETIGREKAGIFRAGRPAVFGSREMPHSIAVAAAQIGARLLRLGHEFEGTAVPGQPQGAWTWASGETRIVQLPRPALAGVVQTDNAAAVIAVLRELEARLPVSRDALVEGLLHANLAGRFEVHPGPVTWIFDVAHNPAAAEVLAHNLASSGSGRTLAVCGVLADKDVEAIVAWLRPRIDAWILAGLAGPRAATAAAMSERFRSAGVVVDASLPDVASACEAARQRAGAGDRVVVFGSFLTVEAAREWFGRTAGRQAGG